MRESAPLTGVPTATDRGLRLYGTHPYLRRRNAGSRQPAPRARRWSIARHFAGVPTASSSPPGATIQRCAVWSRDGRLLQTFSGHNNGIQDLTWQPDGTHVASSGGNGTFRIWSLADGSSPNLTFPSPIYALAWKPDGTEILAGHRDGTVRRLSPTGETLSVLADNELIQVEAVAWSDDGQYLAAGGRGKQASFRIWKNDGELIQSFAEKKDSVVGIEWIESQQRFLAAHFYWLRTYAPDGQHELLGGIDSVSNASLDPSEQRLACGIAIFSQMRIEVRDFAQTRAPQHAGANAD